MLYEITVNGTCLDEYGKKMTDVLDLWVRDPMAMIADLIGNPEFKDDMHYAPVEETVEQVLGDLDSVEREVVREYIFTDFVNTDWWRRVMVRSFSDYQAGARCSQMHI